MTPIQAPRRVSVPRPPTVQTSYLSPVPASSADPSKPAEIGDASDPRPPLLGWVRLDSAPKERG